MRVAGLDHVQIAIPTGGEDQARRFYGALLGLVEVKKPPSLATRGGCWFAGVRMAEDDASTGIRRFYAEDPFGNRVEFVDQRDRGFTERYGHQGVAGG